MNLIYTDCCCDDNIAKCKEKLDIDLIMRIDIKLWSISDALGIITLPNLKLAVINVIDETSVMEMALLHFMCKPILITSSTIKNYPILKEKIIDYTAFDCDLRQPNNNFINWYKMKWES